MRSKFCPSCGGKNEFSYQPPKFCSNCGAPFDTLGSSFSKSALPSKNKRTGLIQKTPAKELREDETDIDQVPSIARLEYDIDIPQDNIHKMSDILNEDDKRS
jgi:hypothetical protein